MWKDSGVNCNYQLECDKAFTLRDSAIKIVSILFHAFEKCSKNLHSRATRNIKSIKEIEYVCTYSKSMQATSAY